MKLYLLTFISLLSLNTSFANAETPEKPGELVSDPKRWVLSRAGSQEKGLVQFECNNCSALKDTVFIASADTCGNAGCDYHLFKKLGKTYKYLGSAFLHETGFEFLKTKHNGLNDFKFCSHMSAMECALGTYRFDGNKYTIFGKPKMVRNEDFSKHIHPEPVARAYFTKDLKPK